MPFLIVQGGATKISFFRGKFRLGQLKGADPPIIVFRGLLDPLNTPEQFFSRSELGAHVNFHAQNTIPYNFYGSSMVEKKIAEMTSNQS